MYHTTDLLAKRHPHSNLLRVALQCLEGWNVKDYITQIALKLVFLM